MDIDAWLYNVFFRHFRKKEVENNENQLVEIPEGKVRGLRERFFQVHVGSPYVRTARRTREIAAGGVKK